MCLSQKFYCQNNCLIWIQHSVHCTCFNGSRFKENLHLITSDSYKEHCKLHETSCHLPQSFPAAGKRTFILKAILAMGLTWKCHLEKTSPHLTSPLLWTLRMNFQAITASSLHISSLAPTIRTRLPSRNCFEDEPEPSPHPQTPLFLRAGKQRAVAAAGKLLNI